MFLAESFFHTLDPFAVRFPNSWPVPGIRWYGLAYAAGFIIGWLTVRWMAKTNRSSIPGRAVGDLVFYIVIGVLVGGRVGYAIFYDPALFVHFQSSLPFWDLLAIQKGGMASHGGMIGVIIACWLFARKYSVPIGHVFDVAALVSLPGLFLGRIANFINAELWGKALPASMQANPPWWSVKYPTQISERWQSVVEQGDQTAAQYADVIHKAAADFNIHASAADLNVQVIAEAQRRLDIVHDQLAPVLGSDAFLYSKVIQHAQNAKAPDHAQVVQVLKPLLTAYYPSQLLQALTDGPILFAMLALIWWNPRKPGVVASWFLILYGVLRIATEVFRQSDVGVSVKFGLQQGQLLSLIMIAAGLVGLFLSVRGKSPLLGGLGRPKPSNIQP